MNIYEYTDPVDYLEAVFQERKKIWSAFTVNQWSQEMDRPKQELLSSILKRKKAIRVRYTSWLNKSLKLQGTELYYFKLLILRASSLCQEEKNLVLETIQDLQRRHRINSKPTEKKNTHFVSHWIYTALIHLPSLKLKGVTAENAHRHFRATVDPMKVAECFQELLDAKVLFYDEQGYLQNNDKVYTSKNDHSMPEVHEYFRQSSDLAKEAISVDVEKRDFQSFSLAVKRERIGKFKELIRQLRKDMSAEICEDGDELYQTNIHFFPLTEVSSSNEGL